ncbi:unnamed protein product [Medioppia subpectinata]|uniref:DNA-directed RNA polymerase III subunit n=1 Tax=Medioppia subpectinata TaxID=1979941 RepID=A0A7R9PU28_9ACAR|nr:unnamed protein product [Medioppia subpectinata]CAG2100344.1 unnamed protein product [Medioppia subpectinata]
MSRGGGRGGKRRDGNSLTFSLESIGLSRGESLPPPTLTPPLNYPSIDAKPLPLDPHNEIDNYLLTLKQELRQSLMTSKYYINASKEKPQIERYSDKYENIANDSSLNDNDIQIDWRIFPTELCPKKSKIKKKAEKKVNKDLDKTLDKLVEEEKDDKSDDQKSDEEVDNASDAEKVEEVEDIEEGTDYTFSYFDNGEDYLDESDDNLDEGPTY